MAEAVVVTGASSGIGRATVRRFAGPGGRLALVARNREALAAAREEVEQDVTYHGSVWGIRAALVRMSERDRGTLVHVGSAMAYRGIPLQAPYCGAKHALQGVFESLRTDLRHRGSRIHLTTVHPPGGNTPQFEHCRDKFDRRSMPVPPVYQPEVAAEAIHWAAHHRHREVYVGVPTVYTSWGNKLAPWLAERYLAKTAVSGQLSDARKRPDGEDNLFTAPRGHPGAHGPYDDRAHPRSLQVAATKHRGLLAAAAGAVATVGGAVLARAG